MAPSNGPKAFVSTVIALQEMKIKTKMALILTLQNQPNEKGNREC